MSIQLVVKHPFATFVVGDHITDTELVARFGASHPEYVVRKTLEDAPSTPAPSPASPSVPTLSPVK